MEIVIYDDLIWKFIDNSYYFKKIYFLLVTSLHHKFYRPAKSTPNYTKKLIFMGIAIITLKQHLNF